MTNSVINDMIETIEYFAQSQPDFPVYNVLGEVHTYHDLKVNSDSLAAKIDSLALPEKSPVVVFGGQEYDMLATFVALTKSGHAYIPIDSHSALERVTAIVEVAQPSLIIAINDFPLKDVNIPILDLAAVQTAFAAKHPYEIVHPVKGDDNYYIIFTSGTTGKPKGVQISHDNLLSFTNWMITDKEFATPIRPQMLAQPPYSFDLSVMYWAPTLALGGTLFAVPSAITQDFKQLFETILNLPIAIWTSTPSFADMAMLSEDFNAEKMPGITHFYFDGEELTVKTAQKLRARFPNARIINAYGPTEATVALSAVAITDDMLTNMKRLPIGYTKADSPTFVIDEDGNKLPNGEQGEIIVSGPAVSKGYMNNPEKTAEAFFEFEGLPAYHTGDVGTMTDEGLLLYGGRMDFQIKFNGFRIELEDVSQNLNKSQYVDSAVAVPRYNKDHKVQNLLAYVILKDGVKEQFEREIDITKAIKEDLQDIMMSYMMPSKFLYRDSLPLTPNGKIDIKGLISEVNNR
ncbi:D-alanine--poly(phosphoribitol) ligase subunit DltA [Streptococcus anginosus subsp. anginosus]|uniref:D-alanine--D-alanyl carrier protein ligase n=2 Tax=Streptococcus anginosus TaxID=1328 RepID=A0A3S4M2E0_STRAP|nr:D-alanine--poly(phosphoribitol) ligase subunit DltA [Streptococcus anginosus]GAD40857.1 non-ribosomal peptide synthetase modules [Streptococcus intermedius SK54 = ATCC 27335]EGL47706.1 D-alanine--poly(phosphoribitol) ligase, subunit 1 [Streptococcus anginosus SK52 = DSM 20563]MBZ2158099.1 D-alanine--poly(phosphoribitol) ligase subunit DltA [Streptococcus anginosus]ORE81620.1 D-alanine--poly(phosphoribitol) ligase [Streptococcus anginosus SK52 = DSM 20563]UEB01688.1 D-alanine--poly(phosphori